MKNRYDKFVFEAEEGITFEVSEGTSGELIIRALSSAANDVYLSLPAVAAGEYAESFSVYTDKNGDQAVVPPGWTVSGAEKENTIWGKDLSLVIYRIPKRNKKNIDWTNQEQVEILQKSYSQIVWVPVKYLDADGTRDGKTFDQKFGRRNYRNVKFSDAGFNEPLTEELFKQFESVKKYGGFYISRYKISKSSKGKAQSVKGAMPWTSINFNDAKSVCATMKNTESIKAHLTYGAEYDSVEAWFIKSGTKDFSEIAEDSTNWGNHWNTENSPKAVVPTGNCEKWCANNIYDFTGNVDEWTQEQYASTCRVIRGADFYYNGDFYPADYRNYNVPNLDYDDSGFRATYYIA